MKNFFTNTVTKIVCWVLLAICSVILIIGGTSAESISSGVALVAGVVTAIAGLIAFISSQIKKEKE